MTSPGLQLARECSALRRRLIEYVSDAPNAVGTLLLHLFLDASPERHPELSDQIRAFITRGLRQAALYVTDETMTDLVEQASTSFPGQSILPSDPPSPHGLVLFARPIRPPGESPEHVDESDVVRYSALAWTTVKEETGETIFVVSNFVSPDLLANDTGLLDMFAEGAVLPPLLPLGAARWHIGDVAETGRTSGADATQKLLSTFWTVAQQRSLANETRERPPRDERRQSARRGVERPDDDVRVVYLRHRDAEETPEAPGDTDEVRRAKREYRHQWIVRGFWRNTWFPSLGAHRQQFIAPHVRGPADKPLLGGDRVTVVTGPPTDGDGGHNP